MKRFFILFISELGLSFLLISCCCDPFSEIFNDINELNEKDKKKLDFYKEIDTQKMELLGEGYWGKTFKLNDNTCLKVLKKIPSQLVSSEKNIENDNVLQVQEVSISYFLEDKEIEGILKIQAVHEYENYYFIKTQLCKGSSLEKYIAGGNYNNNNKLLLNHFLQIANALKNLHGKMIVHMDLKADNVMFAEKDCKNLIIIDLGTAIWYNKTEKPFVEYQQKGAIRNYSYSIAEAISEGNEYDSSKYDIWCLGLILYHMVFGKELFPKYNFTNMLNVGLSFGNKKKYVKNVLEDRKNFDITKDSNVSKLDKGGILYSLLTNILTREDRSRWDLKKIIEEINKHLNLKEKK